MQSENRPESLEDTLVMRVQATLDYTASDPTDRLKPDKPPGEMLLSQDSVAAAPGYLRLPAWTKRHHPSGVCWRVELLRLGGVSPIGLDILGEVILGRTANSVLEPDFDLAPFGGREAGVSRHHAVLKPTLHSIDVLDLGSTNGSRVNGFLLSSGVAYSLKDGDVFSLGALHFFVRIIGRQLLRG